tara:strand:+ start:821 stop:1009 length:189 start_codon:yes stop_codon:yes gene_type:complete
MVYKPNRDKSKRMTLEIRIDPKTGKRTDSLGRPIGKIKPIPPAKPGDKTKLIPLSRRKKKKK